MSHAAKLAFRTHGLIPINTVQTLEQQLQFLVGGNRCPFYRADIHFVKWNICFVLTVVNIYVAYNFLFNILW